MEAITKEIVVVKKRTKGGCLLFMLEVETHRSIPLFCGDDMALKIINLERPSMANDNVMGTNYQMWKPVPLSVSQVNPTPHPSL